MLAHNGGLSTLAWTASCGALLIFTATWGTASVRAADRFAPALRRRVVGQKVRSHNPTSEPEIVNFFRWGRITFETDRSNYKRWITFQVESKDLCVLSLFISCDTQNVKISGDSNETTFIDLLHDAEIWQNRDRRWLTWILIRISNHFNRNWMWFAQKG